MNKSIDSGYCEFGLVMHLQKDTIHMSSLKLNNKTEVNHVSDRQLLVGSVIGSEFF